jgi:hypothetical protein
MDFNELLSGLIANGIIPFTDPAQLNEDQKEGMRQFFELYKEQTKLYAINQQIFINKIVNEYNANGAYLELPIKITPAEFNAATKSWDNKKGASYTKSSKSKVSREFITFHLISILSLLIFK